MTGVMSVIRDEVLSRTAQLERVIEQSMLKITPSAITIVVCFLLMLDRGRLCNETIDLNICIFEYLPFPKIYPQQE